MSSYPERRPRRLRRSPLIRDMVAETTLTTKRLIQPYFVCPGENVEFEIPGMPGIKRQSVDVLMRQVHADHNLGLRRVMLFGVVEDKDANADGAHTPDNPAVRAVKVLRAEYGADLFVSADVCLCAYTDSGHCGIVRDNEVLNDESLPILGKMALALAEAGVDWVAPSDMMDGRVELIRSLLDRNGHTHVGILAYTAKYSSAYYGPFREAAGSSPQFGDRKTYQMDWRNRREALVEAYLDEGEGADVLMVKPALAYLDVIRDLHRATDLPVAAYNVSGEYAMVKLMAREGLAQEADLVRENLTAIVRAGADIILTYHFRDILRNGWL